MYRVSNCFRFSVGIQIRRNLFDIQSRFFKHLKSYDYKFKSLGKPERFFVLDPSKARNLRGIFCRFQLPNRSKSFELCDRDQQQFVHVHRRQRLSSVRWLRSHRIGNCRLTFITLRIFSWKLERRRWGSGGFISASRQNATPTPLSAI